MKMDAPNTAGLAMVELPTATPEVRFAGFWRRFGAWLIDMAIVTAAVVPFSIALIWTMEALHNDLRMKIGHARYLAGLGAVFSWVLADWLYNAQLQSGERQATIGKRCFSIRVTASRGRRISFAQASARHFAKFLSAFIAFLGFVMAAWTRKHQALHDVVADTVVIQD